MRANIEITFNKELVLPIQYNYLLQAVVLDWLGEENYQKFIHDEGYIYNNRKYKLFTFSKLYGKFSMDKIKGIITYFDKANFIISSADYKFLNYLINNVIMKDYFRLGKNIVQIRRIENSCVKVEESENIYTKSPIVIYSTLEKLEKKKTYYYSPYESEFSELLRKNLIHKYAAIYGEEPEDTSFNIKLLNEKRPKESVVNYKGTIIKGWNGEFAMKGSQKLLQMAYDTGLGSKNSQGFGCIELKK